MQTGKDGLMLGSATNQNDNSDVMVTKKSTKYQIQVLHDHKCSTLVIPSIYML